jgi:hypothetical protein
MAEAKRKSSTAIEYHDRPLLGWFTLDVMKAKAGNTRDWVALMIDVDPDAAWRRGGRALRSAWVRIPGKHRNYEAACEALEDMRATRH